MSLSIRPVRDQDIADLVRLVVPAFAPIFASFQQILPPAIYAFHWPDWRAGQQKAVQTMCQAGAKTSVLVAELDGKVVGFLAYELNSQERVGDVALLAVDPDYQNRGIGAELNRVALDRMREGGMTLARVETGGDPSHAPARRAYEKAGYAALPLVRYFQDL